MQLKRRTMNRSCNMKSLLKPFSVAIVAGGIGGLRLAVGLCEEGVTVDIYEAAPAFAAHIPGVQSATGASCRAIYRQIRSQASSC
ncbi:hypothetical protein V1505DRAFT_379180 [Lipomyces doorenjongii]